MAWRRVVVHAGVLFCLALPTLAGAQPLIVRRPAGTQWGVSVFLTPTWTANATLQEQLRWAPARESWPLNSGSELTVGFVRGRAEAGEWGVSFVRKPLEDLEVTTTKTTQACLGQGNAFCERVVGTETVLTDRITVMGAELHLFMPVAMWADRVQLGVNVAAGAGFPTGTVTDTDTWTLTVTQPGLSQIDTVTSTETSAPGRVVLGRLLPLMKLELQAAVLVTTALKTKVSVGFNEPAMFSVRIGAVYLFAARR